jgi:putative component of membrane protein insertase Oxa1/YidC/SpoIIIJ protein YidD
LEAIEIHGVARGSWLGLKRLAQCQPWGGCGHDPVPRPEKEWRKVAARVDKLAAQTERLWSNVCE